MIKLLKRMKEKQKRNDQKQAMNYVVRRTEENKQGNAQEQYVAILCMGTFHSNGYFRQSCMEELAQYEESLPFLVIRLNDWVEEIRNSAYDLVMYRIKTCGIKELFICNAYV